MTEMHSRVRGFDFRERRQLENTTWGVLYIVISETFFFLKILNFTRGTGSRPSGEKVLFTRLLLHPTPRRTHE